MISPLRSFSQHFFLGALLCGSLAATSAFAQSTTGWRPARNPIPIEAPSTESNVIELPTAETAARQRWTPGGTAAQLPTLPMVQQRARPISMQPGMPQTMQPQNMQPQMNMQNARTLPFAEDEIIMSPSPDNISRPMVDGPVMPPNQQGMIMGDGYGGNGYGMDPGCDTCGDGYCGPGGCGTCGPCWTPGCGLLGWCPLLRPWVGCGPCYGGGFDDSCCGPDVMFGERFHPCSWLSWLNETSVATGVQAFKGPFDLGTNGNFGFSQAINVGDVLLHRRGIGYQIGAQVVESDLSGNLITGTSSRTQAFFTVGMFHRAFYGRGWQGGIVFDYLNDNYYVNMNVAQLRYEYSIVGARGHEIGYWGTSSSRTDSVATPQFAAQSFNPIAVTTRGTFMRTVQPMSLNQFFYRRTLPNGGQGRAWIGFASGVYGNGSTTNTDAIVGSDFRVPLSNQFDFYGGYNYIIPSQGPPLNAVGEGWGVMFGLAFYPGRCRTGCHNGPYRPLFNVADNTTMILDSRTQTAAPTPPR